MRRHISREVISHKCTDTHTLLPALLWSCSLVGRATVFGSRDRAWAVSECYNFPGAGPVKTFTNQQDYHDNVLLLHNLEHTVLKNACTARPPRSWWSVMWVLSAPCQHQERQKTHQKPRKKKKNLNLSTSVIWCHQVVNAISTPLKPARSWGEKKGTGILQYQDPETCDPVLAGSVPPPQGSLYLLWKQTMFVAWQQICFLPPFIHRSDFWNHWSRHTATLFWWGTNSRNKDYFTRFPPSFHTYWFYCIQQEFWMIFPRLSPTPLSF